MEKGWQVGQLVGDKLYGLQEADMETQSEERGRYGQDRPGIRPSKERFPIFRIMFQRMDTVDMKPFRRY